MGGFGVLRDGFVALFGMLSSAHADLTARYLLAAVFILAGSFKLQHPQVAADSIVAFGVGTQANPRNGLALGAAEVIIALLLVADQTAAFGALAVVIATLLYLTLIVLALYRGRRFPCACFSSAADDIDSGTALRAGILVVVALMAAYGSLRGAVPIRWSDRPLYVVVAVALIALVALANSTVRVWRRNQRLDLSLDWEWIVQEHSLLSGKDGIR